MNRRELTYEFEWAKRVKERDSYTCQRKKCGRTYKVQAHHVIPLSRFDEIHKHTRCIMLGDIHNGITLCQTCHDKIHEMGDVHINHLLADYKKNKSRSIKIIIKTKKKLLGKVNDKIKSYQREATDLSGQISNLSCQL
jgi:hypothetical protein